MRAFNKAWRLLKTEWLGEEEREWRANVKEQGQQERGEAERAKWMGPCKTEGCNEMASHKPMMFAPTGYCRNCFSDVVNNQPSHGGDPLGRWLDDDGDPLPPEVGRHGG